jgi:hypothetical protein
MSETVAEDSFHLMGLGKKPKRFPSLVAPDK